MVFKAKDDSSSHETKTFSQQPEKLNSPAHAETKTPSDPVTLQGPEIAEGLEKDFALPEKEDTTVRDALSSLETELSATTTEATEAIKAISETSPDRSVTPGTLSGRPPEVQTHIVESAENIEQIAKGQDKNPIARITQERMDYLLS